MIARMSPAASFSQRWAAHNLSRPASPDELTTLNLILATCDSEEQASKRARSYYTARGPGGLTELWHKRHPDDEDILSSCQDAHIVPLKSRRLDGRRMTIVRLPAPTAQTRSISARALLARWLMILDIRLREDPTPGDEVVFVDVSDLQPSHLKNHFKGTYWKDFIWCMKHAYPHRFTEIHIINTERIKTMSLLLLHIGLYPWRRRVHVHSHSDHLTDAEEYFPIEGLPYEYGGKAGAMKDLNDEWTKKLLSNSKWLASEERKFYNTDLKPAPRSRLRHKSAIRPLRSNGSYDMITRTHSCKSLHRQDDIEDAMYGDYRTLRLGSERLF